MKTRITSSIIQMGVFLGMALSSIGTYANQPFADSTIISSCQDGYKNNPDALGTCLQATSCDDSGGTPSQIYQCQMGIFNSARSITTPKFDQVKSDPAVQRDALAPGESYVNQPTQPASAPADKNLVSQVNNQCKQTTDMAKNYCKDPLKYSTDGSVDIGSRENATMATNLMMFGGMMAGNSSKGICEFMKKGGGSVTALNTMFATRCGSFINDCETACEASLKDAEKITNTATKIEAVAEAEGQLRICRAQRNRQGEMTGSAMQAFMANQAGKVCGDAVTAAAVPTPPEFDPGKGSCAADPSNPLCVGGQPGGGFPGGGYGNGLGDGSDSAMNSKDPNDINVNDLAGDMGQSPVSGGAQAKANQNSGVPNGGGGMIGGGDSGGGGADEGGRQGAAGSGVSANVLQGERGGGGYSVAPGGGFAASGGWSGYGAGEGGERGGGGIDLRKFLPGASGSGPTRGPAGLNRANAEVAPMHEDIFKKISDRVKVVCKTNRIRDCNQ